VHDSKFSSQLRVYYIDRGRLPFLLLKGPLSLKILRPHAFADSLFLSSFRAMFKFFCIAVLALALRVSGLVVPRQSPPAGWTSELENYGQYHTRYMALQCENKHGSQFFADCCHPLLSTQTLQNDRKPYCIPGSTPSTVAKPPSTQTSTSATPASSPSTNGGGQVQTGGFATFFYQGGVAGACGTVHQDSDFIAAIDQNRYGDSGAQSSLCGKQVKITNTNNQKTVTVTIADDCPTCQNGNSIDLSVGAFTSIATEAEGMVPIDWEFI